MLTLTPQARAIAAFTLAVLVLTAQLNRATIAVVLLFGDAFPAGRSGQFLAGLILVAVALMVLLFAMTAAKGLSGGLPGGWESHLAQAAVLVAAVGLGIDVVTAVAGVLHDNGFAISGVLGGGRYAG
ncbi:MAG: hypothetical protein ACJ72D_18220 [Marmoricola sp.]